MCPFKNILHVPLSSSNVPEATKFYSTRELVIVCINYVDVRLRGTDKKPFNELKERRDCSPL